MGHSLLFIAYWETGNGNGECFVTQSWRGLKNYRYSGFSQQTVTSCDNKNSWRPLLQHYDTRRLVFRYSLGRYA